jgi:hypothetical protein
MPEAIPSAAFLVFTILFILYFIASISLYNRKRQTFPVKQRLPYFVMVESCLISFLGIYVLLMFASSENSIFRNCTMFSFVVSPLAAISVSMMAFRVSWIVLTDLFTKILVQDERITTTQRQGVPISHTAGNPITKFILFLLSQARRIGLSKLQISLLVVIPGCALDLIYLFYTYKFGYLADVQVTSQKCQEIIGSGGYLAVMFFLYFVLVGSVIVVPLLKLNDNFSMGKEIRALVVLGVVMSIMANTTSSYAIYNALIIQTRAWNFVVGVVTVPLVIAVQLLFPVYLSIQHESNQKRREDATAHDNNPRTIQSDMQEMMKLISTESGRALFLAFLELEFSVENLFFIEACKCFKKSYSQRALSDNVQEALLIRNMFIHPSSPHCVNISYKTRQQVLTLLQPFEKENRESKVKESVVSTDSQSSAVLLLDRMLSVDLVPEVFDLASEEVMNVLTKDTFIRFKYSPSYKNLYMTELQESKS